MSVARWSRHRTEIPDEALQGVALGRGEKVLAAAAPSGHDGWVVATTYRLVLTGEGGWERPWHHVDGASWSREAARLVVTWVDGARPAQWALDDAERLLTVVRERVQASAVLTHPLDLGDRRSGRVAIRRNLATGELFDQVVLGRFARPDDPEVADQVWRVRAYLREQVGMPLP